SSIKAPTLNRTWVDRFCIMIIIIMTPFFYIYDVFYVLPQLLGPFLVTLNAIVGTWISYNILGNLWACCRNSSSVYTLPPELRTPAKGEEHLWRYCKECQILMPPRSWHCKVCKFCILKREHHCNFTGNCIGHNNQRFFIWLTFHLSFGTGLALIYNFIFAWQHGSGFGDVLKLNVMVFLKDSIDPSYVFKCVICLVVYVNILCLAYSIFMFTTEVMMVRRNTVMFDRSNLEYDMGARRNFGQVMGKLQFWTCLSPAINSPLPHPGVQWQSKGRE
ncbi:hypothetical protein KR054_005156, partial [Drosophila jambulina]